MKPTKNRIFCKDCGKPKMLFETEKKADTFIKFNSDEIEQESGYKPERSYFCIYCGGWHVTSIRDYLEIKSKTEILLDKYKEEKEKKAILQQERSIIRLKKQEELKKILSSLENEIYKLQSLELNSISFNETLQKAVNELEKIKNYKGFSSKGSNKRIKDAQEKIVCIKNKTTNDL